MRSHLSVCSSPDQKLRLLLLAGALALLLMLALPGMAGAATIYWNHTGGPLPGSVDWDNPLNWNPQQVPGAGDYAVMPVDAETKQGVVCHHSLTVQGIDLVDESLFVEGDLTLTQGTSILSSVHNGMNVTGALTVLDTLITGRQIGVWSGTERVVNYGTIIGRQESAVVPWIEQPVENHGLVTCDSGTLQLQSGVIGFAGSQLGGGDGTVELHGASSSLAGGCRLLGNVLLHHDDPVIGVKGKVTIPAGATVTAEGTNSALGGNLAGPGTLRIPAGSNLIASSIQAEAGLQLHVEGALDLVSLTGSATTWDAGTVIDNSGTIDLQGDVHMLAGSGAGTIVNGGTLTKSAGTGTSTINLGVTNNGVISVRTGTLTLGALSNYNGSTKTLSGGSYVLTAPGALYLPGEVTTLAGDVALSGAAAQIKEYWGNALRNLASITPAGSLQLLGGQALATPALANQGTVRIGADSSLTTSGPYTQSSGRTTLVAPTSTLASTGASAGVTFSGGYLYGCGTVAPSLTNTGACLRPSAAGTPYGTLSVAGPYTQGAAGTLEIDLGGTAAGQYDVLAASGLATLAGVLRTASPAGYVPAKGDSFAVLTCGSRSGTFLSAGGGKKSSARPAFQFVYSAGGLTLKAT